MQVDELFYLMKLLEDRHLETVYKKEMERIVDLKAKIKQMIYNIEDGKDGD